ncbi:hypothetical protein N7468_003891 [Penicillium chermesinum]|uniref:RRM domain-containing protein n=1 Tax=Penicillium chermesinum TaxID=63820 RepID=A0A9W9TS85_9EURO|nr:uncharacterized protein N7468_003891 [Penicillium chermesinum]KAJ5239272.1 hypothetical protein N7468_003891 [Penicillium chermesinum]KAJ6164903.1 hypothetical protein N7470_003575 [Penicillium chermesinum]
MAPGKSKAQKMSIGTFLADESLGSWADEMEDMPLPAVPSTSSFDRRPLNNLGFGGSGGGFERETRGGYAVREPLDLPTEPPFTAHVGNLSFEATADDISDLFAGCGVTNVRIVEDKLTKAPKGFGYVEFETVDGLQKALDLSGTTLQGRTIRTSVAEPPKESRPDMRDLDWTRRGPLPGPPERRPPPDRASFGRNLDPASDASSERGSRRNFESDGKARDFNTWERKGPLPPSSGGPREGRPGTNDGPNSGFRKNSPAWGEGRSQDGSRPRPLVLNWRARMRPDQASKEASNPPSPSAAPAAPASRPKLNLQKRTVSEATPSPTSTGGDSKASPFGAARPIDTAAREREVEEKRQMAIRQKKEAEDKAAAGKEKAEKSKQKEGRVPGTDSNKDSIEPPRGGGNFEILRRAEEESGVAAEKEPENTAVAATPDAEKPAEAPNGNWRTSETTDDNDGWSTVGAKPRNNRRGQPGRGFA